MKLLEKEKDLELAKSIFKAWDTANKGYISVEELTEKLIGLGLCTTTKFTSLLLMTISKKSEILTLKGFLKVF
jgi:Ca2+-binding EF-hand superfamily protein